LPLLPPPTTTHTHPHQERHDAGDELCEARDADQGLVSKWRQKDKLKTTGGGMGQWYSMMQGGE